MITTKKSFILTKSQLGNKFRVENNNLDISALIINSGLTADKLGDLASPHRKERNRKETANNLIKYVQISDIDVNIGRIKSYRRFRGSDAPNNARRIMNHGDIIISTRRPTRGAIVTVPKEFDQEICSVFFTSLLVHDWNKIDPWYLSLFLRTSLGRFQFQSLITETAYPVISDEDVNNIFVLYPDIDEQRRLVSAYNEDVIDFFSKLNEAYYSINKSRQNIENVILGAEAETLTSTKFGLEFEELTDESDDTADVQTDTDVEG